VLGRALPELFGPGHFLLELGGLRRGHLQTVALDATPGLIGQKADEREILGRKTWPWFVDGLNQPMVDRGILHRAARGLRVTIRCVVVGGLKRDLHRVWERGELIGCEGRADHTAAEGTRISPEPGRLSSRAGRRWVVDPDAGVRIGEGCRQLRRFSGAGHQDRGDASIREMPSTSCICAAETAAG